ncbi:hypothetical protein N7523_004634 [Penicillium sp. IBT 18751x]|nr:hypothetical protein N7523_004634 [Penicillium sp. IBT 18751x]
MTGILCTSYYLLQDEPSTLEGLQEYHESPNVSRFTCKTCGSHVLAQVKPSGRYLVASGVLVAGVIPKVQSVQHWQVKDTGDGGLSTYLPGWPTTDGGCRLAVLSGQPGNTARSHSQRHMRDPSKSQTQLQARCHCGGIEFYITQPDSSSTKARSPFSDLLIPWHTGSGDNPDDVKWWLRNGNTKYFAGICVCKSCRLGCGFPIQPWAFVPKANIFNADGSPLKFEGKTMRRYNSSPGVYRDFCEVCGANAFWHCDERPELIDVSIGLVYGHGALAKDFLEWASERVSFAEMAIQTDLVKLLEDGLNRSSAD